MTDSPALVRAAPNEARTGTLAESTPDDWGGLWSHAILVPFRTFPQDAFDSPTGGRDSDSHSLPQWTGTWPRPGFGAPNPRIGSWPFGVSTVYLIHPGGYLPIMPDQDIPYSPRRGST